MFIAIEGIDQSGKETQAKILAERLEGEVFPFPNYETPSGILIASHLKKEWKATVDFDEQTRLAVEQGVKADEDKLNAMVYQCLQFSNRLESAQKIRKTLQLKIPVIADRYIASGLVYGTVDGLDFDYMWNTQQFLPQPDLNILIDIDVEDSFKRKPENRDRYESNRGFLAHVRSLYVITFEKMEARNGVGQWKIVDGRQSVTEVAAEISVAVKETRALI